MNEPSEIDQHISWMQIYISTANENNWRDNLLRLERQLDQLEIALAASQRREGGA